MPPHRMLHVAGPDLESSNWICPMAQFRSSLGLLRRFSFPLVVLPLGIEPARVALTEAGGVRLTSRWDRAALARGGGEN